MCRNPECKFSTCVFFEYYSMHFYFRTMSNVSALNLPDSIESVTNTSNTTAEKEDLESNISVSTNRSGKESHRKRRRIADNDSVVSEGDTAEKFLDAIAQLSSGIVARAPASVCPTPEPDEPKLFCDKLCLSLRRLHVEEYEEAEIEILSVARRLMVKTRARNKCIYFLIYNIFKFYL